MAMFKKEKTRMEGGGMALGEGGNETVIGPTVKVDGDFTSDGNVLVQGVVNGSLKTKGNLHVEPGAKIKADVEAANARVLGSVKGNVTIRENLELGESAAIEGDIVTKVLSIEPGAILNGHCSVSTERVDAESELAPAAVQKPANHKREGVV